MVGVYSNLVGLYSNYQQAQPMPKKRITQIDLDTGEELPGTLVYVGVKFPPIYGKFYMGNHEANIALSKDRELTGNSFRVLHYLIGHLNYENFIQIPQTQIVNDLEIHKTTISKEINLLLKKGILIRGPKVGKSYAFRLNPFYAYRGKSKNGRKWITDIIQGGKIG